jgi:osmoprotectant transport system substrate-binding protein
MRVMSPVPLLTSTSPVAFRRLPRGVTALISALLLLLLAACGGGDAFDDTAQPPAAPNPTTTAGSTPAPGEGAEKGQLTIGSGAFTESQVMAEMYAALLEAEGYGVEVTTVQNRELYEPALESGQIDIVPEYAATLAEFLNLKVNGKDAEPVASADIDETIEALRGLAEQQGLVVFEPAEAVDQNAFAVTQEFAQENDLKSLSDFGQKVNDPITLAAVEECPQRPFCQPGLEDVYGIEIKKVQPLGFDTVQTKEAVQSGQAELGLVATTDGTLEEFGLVVLDDDKGLQNADNLVPVANASVAEEPGVEEALNKLAPVLTTEDLAELNRKVDAERAKPADVALQYLEEKGLL